MAESTERPRTDALTTTDLAYRALLDHATKCPRCAVNWQECPTRRALSTTLREAR